MPPNLFRNSKRYVKEIKCKYGRCLCSEQNFSDTIQSTYEINAMIFHLVEYLNCNINFCSCSTPKVVTADNMYFSIYMFR